MPVRFLLALCALLSCQWAQAQDEGELLFPGFGDGAGIDDLLDELDALVDDLAGPQVTAERSWITQPYRLDLTAGGDTTSPAGCPGFFGSSTQLSINYQPIAGVSELQIIAESADDTTLWVMVNGTEHRCDDDSYGNANPIVTLAASELGNGALIGVRVGTYDSGYADARLSVRAEASSSPSPALKQPSNRTAAPAATRFADLAEGFVPDPLVLSGLGAGGANTPSLDDCAYGFIPDLPQASIVYDSDTGTSNLAFYAESDVDTTLVVVYENQSYFCDDDSHGNADPLVVITDADSGQYQVWIGTYSEDQSAAATLFVSEKRPQ